MLGHINVSDISILEGWRPSWLWPSMPPIMSEWFELHLQTGFQVAGRVVFSFRPAGGADPTVGPRRLRVHQRANLRLFAPDLWLLSVHPRNKQQRICPCASAPDLCSPCVSVCRLHGRLDLMHGSCMTPALPPVGVIVGQTASGCSHGSNRTRQRPRPR